MMTLDLNKAENHTLKNDIDNEDFVVDIQPKNEVNDNEEHLSETSSMNEEEMIIETTNDLNEILVIEKDMDENIRDQPNHDL